MTSPQRYRVVVVGGGMVGAAFAGALAGRGHRVAVVEAHPPEPWSASEDYDLRVSAFSRASQSILDHLGAWRAIAAARVSPYDRMQVWDAGSGGEIHFDAADLGETCLGHIIENRLVQSVLIERLAANEAADLLCPAEPVSVTVGDAAVELLLADGRRLQAELLVAADGGRSRLRTLLGVGLDAHEYGQSGLVCCVGTERPHDSVARQRFMPGGPLAFLPLADGRCSIVWTRPTEEAEMLRQLPEADLAERLEQALEGRLGRITSVGPRAAFDLRRQHAERYVGPRFALIGDAAHTIHPLAGQGVNLGLLDAAALAEVLEAGHGDWGRLPLLRRYERWRRGENEIMLRAMDGFRWLFDARAAPLRGLRALGLNLTDRLGPVKLELMRRAMGLSGDLPVLARP